MNPDHKEVYTSDRQMIKLIEILKSIGAIRFKTDFCNTIGLLKQNLQKIENGENHFTPSHIEMAIKKFDANGNWIFGMSKKIFNNEEFYNKDFTDIITNTKSYTKPPILD